MTTTITYVSYDYFVDVDFQIINELNKLYDFHYFVIFSKQREHAFKPETVKKYCEENKIKFDLFIRKQRARHPEGLKIAYDVVKKIKNLNAEVVYFEGFTDPYLPIICRSLLGKDKVVVGIHDVVLHKKLQSFLFALYTQISISLFQNFHVFSNNQKEAFIKRYPKKNVFIARLSTYNYGQADRKHIERQNRDRKINFLFFGNIHHYKGLEILIAAVNTLAAKVDNYKVTIAGRCTDFSFYDKLIEKRDVFDLKMHLIPSEEVPGLFADADFLVLPYRDVTQSGPLMIAFNYCVPVIASDLPGFREQVKHGETGYLFQPENPEALAECMEKAMNAREEERIRLKKNIQKYVGEEINLDTIIKDYATFLNGVHKTAHSR